ncbi:MAG: dehydratase [Robiginitomaculum sp.]|nr:MAG: dehydratase [Robiginitomaculum sp.]
MTQTHVEIIKTLTQDDFNRFAALSGDYNPIHVDPVFSAKTKFGKTVAHGALLVTILRGLTDQLIKNGKQISHQVKFTAPTFTGDEMKFSTTLIKTISNTHHIKLQVRRLSDDTVTCEGEAMVSTKKDVHASRT